MRESIEKFTDCVAAAVMLMCVRVAVAAYYHQRSKSVTSLCGVAVELHVPKKSYKKLDITQKPKHTSEPFPECRLDKCSIHYYVWVRTSIL